MKLNRWVRGFRLSILIAVGTASSVAQARLVLHDVDLFSQAQVDTSGLTPQEVHANNLSELAAFIAADNADTDDSQLRPKYLNPRYAQEIYSASWSNPVVSLNAYGKYDPDNMGIGFCFGRAMFVHLELAYRGFDRDSVRKAFVMGRMQTPDGASWGWHVTTIAQSKDARGQERWLAIDPITGVMELGAWYAKMRDELSTDKKLKLYLTLPTRFSPFARGYLESDLRSKTYNQYFDEMLGWFEAESAAGRYDGKQIAEY